jgi:nitrate reductase / nitrite oxidoreductase, alpha subunit
VDRVVRTTCSPNCTGSCGQLAFVRDDRVVKIQQAADFPDEVYNPRGLHEGPVVPPPSSTAPTASTRR